MALDAKTKDLLNKFADSQPALNDSALPRSLSGIKLGDLLDAVIIAAAAAQASASAAASQAYVPAAGADWANPDPTTIQQAIDRLAAEVAVLAAGPIP